MRGVVSVSRAGDKVWSANTKEQLCEAFETLSAEVARLRKRVAELEAQIGKLEMAS